LQQIVERQIDRKSADDVTGATSERDTHINGFEDAIDGEAKCKVSQEVQERARHLQIYLFGNPYASKSTNLQSAAP
jgi:hypothetical protein